MENKNKEQTGTFDNLKYLNQLVVGTEINQMVSNMKRAKTSLETYYKKVKNVISSKVEEVSKVVEKPVEVSKPIEQNRQSSFEPEKPVESSQDTYVKNQRPQNTRSYNNDRPYSQNNNNNNYNRTNGDRPYTPNNNYNRTNGDRPYTPNSNYNRQSSDRPYTPNSNYNRQSSDRPYTPNNNYNRPNGDRPYTPNSNYNRTNGDRPYTPNNNFNRQSSGDRPYQSRNNFQNNRPNTASAFNKDRPNNFAGPRTAGARPFVARKPATTVPEITVPKNDRTFGNKNKSHKPGDESKSKSIKTKIKMGIVQTEDLENEERMGRVRVKNVKKPRFKMEQVKTVVDKAVITTENLTVKILSEKIGKPVVDIIKQFMLLGMMLNINSVIDYPTAELVSNELGVSLELKLDKSFEVKVEEKFNEENKDDLIKRAPIVTVMGHVDHGKTSLLDAIKKTNVIAGEAGGITQHIGSYTVNVGKNKVTFIDTPGHAAFTAMRQRGAQVTDIAILVVAADDGIMPQTVEAINHIKSANVPMIVAINKIDKPEANIEKVKQQLTEYGIVPEEWGGETICVPISAKNNLYIDKLLDMILLLSDMLELKADPSRDASAYVIESKIDKGRGIVTNIIVKDGTLKIGDYVVAGLTTGRVKGMVDYLGNIVKVAGPSMAVSITGLNIAPEAGDLLYVLDEKTAKNLIAERASKIKVQKTLDTNGVDLQDFLSHNIDEQLKVLKVLIKADVKGSVEALSTSLENLKNEEVKVEVIHSGVGGINESDVVLAQASNAIIIGFNTKIEAKSKKLAESNKVNVKMFKVIYEAVDYITEIITGMKAPKYEERVTAHIEVRHLFKISSVGTIAGCYVLDGNVVRNNGIRVLRNKEEIFKGAIDSLKIMKDDVKQVKFGFECGVKIKGFNDFKEGDILESYENVKTN